MATVYIAMWPLVTYSNYFERVSTVTFLVLQTRLILGICFMFNTVILRAFPNRGFEIQQVLAQHYQTQIAAPVGIVYNERHLVL